jgi:hypothetical protein
MQDKRRPRVLERTAKQSYFISFALKARFRRCFTRGAGGFFCKLLFTEGNGWHNDPLFVLTEVD